MMQRLALWRTTALIGLRNLRTHTTSTWVVGPLMFFATALLVMGSALLDGIDAGMERSITSSFVGNLQVYSSEGRDELSLLAKITPWPSDIGEIRDFEKVEEVLLGVDNVKHVVPMGQLNARVPGGNAVDRRVEAIRFAAREGAEDDVTQGVERLRRLIGELRRDYRNRSEVMDDTDELREALGELKRVDSDSFWADRSRLEDRLLEVSDRIAPLDEEDSGIVLALLGTDMERFPEVFDRFRIVKGETVPPGARGLLVSEQDYEGRLKHQVARWLDSLDEDSADNRQLLRDNARLADRVRELPDESRRITLDQDPKHAQELKRKLSTYLERDGELEELVQEFLTLTPENFDERYRAFYELVAPHIELRRVEFGEEITMSAAAQSGSPTSIKVKVYGVYTFDGLDGSPIAGAQVLADMVTFRALYGAVTDEMRQEFSELQNEVDVAGVSLETAEDQLFGEESSEPEQRESETFDELSVLSEALEGVEALGERFEPERARQGLVLHAAVILEDPTRLDESLGDIRDALNDAGLKIEAVDWLAAMGVIGQLVPFVHWVLYVASAIVFLVALVIINNSMVMATLERTAEIGTMRAMGSPRGVVSAMIFLETLSLGVIAGGLGVLVGGGFIVWLNQVGLPAGNDFFVLLFAGPRLFPMLSFEHAAMGFVSVVAVSLVSTWYPARLASRVQPVVAMRSA